MKLFYAKSACSLVVRIILNELNIGFQDEAVDLRAKKTASGADYLTINPKGAVPAIQLDNGEVLTENQVILQYLSDTTKGQNLLAPVGDFKRYRTLEWLNFVSTEIHKSFGSFFNPNMPEEIKKDIVVPMILQRFARVDAALSNSSYLLGDAFTLPDAYLFVMIRWAKKFKFDLAPFKNLEVYDKRLLERASIIKSLQQEQL